MPIVASVVKRAATATSADVDRRRARRRVPRRARRRTAARRSSTSRSTCSVRRSVDIPAVDAAALRGAAPDPAAVAGGREARRRGRATGAVRRRRRVLGARRRRAASRSRRRRGVPVFVQRHGPRHDPGRPRARVLAGAVGRAEGSRPRARRGDAARLPARVRPVRRRAGRAPVRRRDRGRPRTPTSRRRPRGDLARDVHRARRRGRTPAAHDDWIAQAARRRAGEARGRGGRRSTTIARPITPTRIYGELRHAARPRRDRDRRRRRLRVVRGQVRSTRYEPGTFLDPGPVRLPRHGAGLRARGRRSRIPTGRSCCMLGDGAAGFALGDFEALVRHGVDVVAIVGNNGIWGLEKHPMQALFGYDVVAELRPGIRYDEVVDGARAATASASRTPDEIGPALDRAFATQGRLARERAHRPGRRLPAVEQPRLSAAVARSEVERRALGAEAERGRGPSPSSARGWRAARAAMLLDHLDARCRMSASGSTTAFTRWSASASSASTAAARRGRARGRPRRRRGRASGP